MIRSGFRPMKTWRRPSFSVPIRLAAGTRTSSKNRVNCFSGVTAWTGMSDLVSPGTSVGTTSRLSSPRPLSLVDVRVTTRIASASSTPEM
ncbi:Uncharacterised protein [Mycobacteroides abscessus subsp. abscessus]|nr:Uncharacterised protein [Mycobacteroides abscessus subsp. abscessus]